MRQFDPRLLLGGLFILGGVLALLGAMDVISNAGGIFWGLIFAAGGVFFLYIVLTDRNNWWAAFPAFTLFGLAASLEAYKGLVFFLGISLGFWWVYFTGTERWWAIIPGGVLLTLGVVSALDNMLGDNGGGLFFLGLGLTFVLVAVLPGGSGRSWALIPGVVLLLFGAIQETSLSGITGYIWPAVLILLGGFFILRFFRNRPSE